MKCKIFALGRFIARAALVGWRALFAWRTHLVAGFLLSLILLAASPFVLRWAVMAWYERQQYPLSDVPPQPVAIIFGAQVRPSGRLSDMLADRVRTGADLYHAGKVQKLLLSGDNLDPSYNEPAAMRRFALELGVPEEALILDYGGLRTYDSCYRAKALFGVGAAVLVTQDFHLDRALMICEALGLESVGVAADYHRPYGYSPRSMGWSRWREVAATSVAVWDILWRPAPRLGLDMPRHQSSSPEGR
jgi:SanA protein